MAEELKLVITVDKDGAISGIKQVQDAETQLQDETRNTGLVFTEFNSILEIGTKAFSAISEVAKTAIDAIKEGSRIDDVATAFNRLATNAGVVSDVFLNQLNQATGATISNFDLMRQANEAIQKGLTPEQFTTAAAAARELSDTLGTDLNQELAVISQALETGNAKILQNKIGVIDLEKAEREFAATLGVKREELNREGQIQAARLEIMRQLSDEAIRGNKIEADNADLLDQMTAGLNNQFDALKRSLGANTDLNKALKSTNEIVKGIDFTPVIQAVNAMAVAFVNAFNEITSGFLKLNKFLVDSVNNFSTNIKLIGGYATREAKLLANEYLGLNLEVKDLDIELQSLANSLNENKEVLQSTAPQVQQLDQQLQSVTQELTSTEQAASASAAEIKKYTTEVNKANQASKGFSGVDMGMGQFEPGASGEAGLPIGEQIARQFSSEEFKNQIGGALAQSIGQGLDAALNGGNSQDFKQITKQFGAQAGQAAGMAIGTAIGGPIGGMIGGEIGGVLGEKAGKAVFDAFNHVFGGGRDPGTKARKNIEAWFDTLLKDSDLRIIKDDQLIDLKEFDRLGDAFEENWVDHFNEIAGESADTFSAIGQGLTGIIGVAEDFGSQIAYIMAENLGGSLNNLQLMFYKTGLSVEELRGQLLDAFMDGKLSADDFMGALAGINQVMTEGIPDGFGMTSAALDNLFASSGRGIASLDALRDIFIEAGEVGINSFEGLRENLIAAGQSAEQVDALFKVLSDAGIGSFEQVLEGSDEFLIGLIANLDDAGFQFAELNQTIDDLSQKLDDLERGRDIDITLNVRTNADASSQRLIDAGALPGVA